MADWIGAARSNYFRVKDAEAFKLAMAEFDVDIWPVERDGITLFALGSDSDHGAWPSYAYDNDGDGDEVREFEIWKEVAPHLADGSIAVFQECGAEKLRYLTGWSVAVDNTGKEVWVSMNDIYAKAAEEFGTLSGLIAAEITTAEY